MSTSVHMHDALVRELLNVGQGETKIHLDGLIPGNTYRVVAVPGFAGQKAAYTIRMMDAEQETEALKQSRPDRPQSRQFTATSEETTLRLNTVSETPADQIPVYLSVHCLDCPHDDSWRENFDNQAKLLANLQTTGGVSATSLISNTLIGGNCFDVTNITSSGQANSRGTFSSGGTNIGLNTGAVLCTGNVNVLPGPNNATNASGNTAGFNANSPDDPDLATLTGGNQWDVSVIEFNFTPTASQVQFDYVFGSEEYCEWVGSNFNDVFGFFISGPGISGTQNIALLPSTSTPVAINNVNYLVNTAYYVNNNNFNPCTGVGQAAPNECQLDGWTTVLTATANLEECETYHIKLAIADIGDGALASAVFLKANSFDAGGTVKAIPVYPAGQSYAVEGCAGGFIRFVRAGGDINEPLVVNFTVGGTATVGEDYMALPTNIVIPPGQTEVLIPVTVFADLIAEGQETIVITLSNPCACSLLEMTFVIEDKPPLEIEMQDVVLCGGTGATLTPDFINPGLPNYTYLWSNNLTTSSINVTTPGTNTYTVTVTDACGTTATASATTTIEPAPTATLSGNGILCAGASGMVNVTITLTGVGPWEVEINNNGSIETQTFTSSPATYTITDPGNYSLVSVSSQSGCPGTATGSVTINEITVNLSTNAIDPPCFGSNGSIQASANGGNGPFTFTWNTNATGPNLTGIGPGTYTVTATNAQGCTAEETVTLEEPPQLTASVNNSNNIDCNNPTGSADLEVGGGTPGYTFNWSNSSNQEDPNFTAGGTYTVTVTDSHNCSATATVSITANTTLPVAVIAPPGQITCNATELFLDATGSSTGPQFTYEWTGGGIICCETTLQPQINSGGTYTLVVTNTENGCTKLVTVTVVENNTPPNVNINTPQNIGCTNPTLTLNGNGTTTGAGIVFTWTTPDGNFVCCTNTLQPQINQAGTYTLTVVNNNNGCTNEETVTVTGNTDPPVAQIVPPALIDCYNPEFELDAGGSSQGGNFTYNWSASGGGVITGGGNTLNPSINMGGTYTLTVTNSDNNCTATASVTVTANLTPPVAVATANGTLTCQNPTLVINGNGSSTGANFTYEWTTPDGNIVSGENTLNPVVDMGGSYTLVVTNTTNGCTNSATVNVNDNQDQPVVSAGPSLELNCTSTSLQLQGSGSSGPPGFTILWTANPGNIVSGANTYTPVINQEGTYTVVVTNTANGCTSEDFVTVSSNFNTPAAVINPPAVIDCYSPTIDLDAGSTQGGNLQFNWSTTNGSISAGSTSPYPTVNQAGTYTLVVTDTESGCTSTASVTVTQNTTPPVAVATGGGTLTCQNPVLVLNGTGSSTGSDFSYEWTTSNGNIVSGESTLNPVIDQAGTYTLVVTNLVNGCTKIATVNVTSNQNFPVANAGPDLLLNCLNPTLQLQGSGSSGAGYTIQWTANPGFIVSGANTYTPTINQAGTYYLVVTNTANGCTTEEVVNIDSNFDQPVAVVQPPAIIDCYNLTIDLDAGSSTQGNEIQYTWTTPNGSIVSGSTSPYPTVNQAGTYNLVVTNTLSGCKATASVTVIKNTTPPAANAGPGATLNCNIAQLTLNGTGSVGSSFTYLWVTGSGNIVSGENTLNPVIDAPGNYLLVVTNEVNGCTAESSVTINADQNAPVAYSGNEQQLTCAAMSVTLSGSGSSTGPNYSYQWVANPGNIVSGASTLNNAVVDAAGYYTLIVTNNTNGCTAESEVFVDDNIIYPNADILTAQQLNCAFTTVQLDAGGSSQGNNIDYTWTTSNGTILSGNGTPYPEVGTVGTYNLLVTNTDNACTATASVTVTQDIALPTATAIPTVSITCQSPQTQLNGNGSSSGYPFFYEWTTTNGNIVSGYLTLTPTVNQPGTYVLTVYNVDNGCSAQATVQVTTSQTFPTADAGPAQNITCAAAQLTLDGSGSSQSGPYNYIWSTQNGNIVNGANSLTPTVNAPGTYELTVINTQTGCTSAASVAVGLDISNPTATVAPGGELSCLVTSLALNGAGSSSGAGFTYTWSTANGTLVSGQGTLNPVVSATGTYVLLVTNTSNGCTATASTQVTADAGLPVANAGPTSTLTCLVTQVALDGSASSQGPGLTYLWSGPGIVSGINTLTPTVDEPGQYSLTITNSTNGCTAISSVNIPANLIFPNVDAGPASILNCTNTSLTLQGTQSTGNITNTYSWTAFGGGNILSGADSLAPVINQPGGYVLLATNSANGCADADTVMITQDVVLPLANAGSPGLITCTNTTVTLNGSGSTGGNFSYLWTTPDGSISGGANTLTPVADAPGIYNLLVTNTVNGCTATASTQVLKDDNVPVAVAQIPAELSCVLTELQLNGTGSTAGPAIQYTWTTTNGNLVSGENTLTPQVNEPGQYTLTVFNSTNNCQAQFTVNVNQNLTAPTADAGAPAVLSCSSPVLSLNGNGSSQGAAYSYLWSTSNGNILNGQTTLTPKVDHSGIYTLVVTDNGNGCTATSTVQILLDQNSPQAEAGPQQAITCVVNSLTLNSSGTSVGPNFVYEWTASGGGNIVSGNSGLSPVVNAPGTYTLLVTNPTNGCTSIDSVLVVVDQALPVATVAAPPVLNCALTQAALNTTGSSNGSQFSYKWTTTGGNILSGGNSPTPIVNKPGQYNLVITNTANGCTSTVSATVTQDIVHPVVDAGSNAELNCLTTSLTLNGTAGSVGPNVEYAWTTTNGSLVSGDNTLTPVINGPGIYILTVTNLDNFCTATDQVPVSQNINPPTAIAAAGPTLTCAVPTASLDANGSSAGALFAYQWVAQNGGNILSGANTLVPTINAPGLYVLTVSNTNNKCTTTATVTVNQDIVAPTALAGNTVTLTCTSPSLQLNGAGSSTGAPFTYLWSTINGNILSGETTLQPVIGQAGLYTLVVSNQVNGCTKESSVQVLQDANAPVAAAAAPGELTCLVQALSLTGTGSSTGANFNYLWSTSSGQILSGTSGLTPVVAAPGDYNLLVTNTQNGCTKSASVSVTQNITPPSVLINTPGVITCAVPQLNLLSIGTGSGQGLNYNWTSTSGTIVSGANSASPVVSAGGQYFLTITDVYNGCSNTAQVTVPADVQAPAALIALPNLLSCLVFQVTLNAAGSAQGSQYTYGWTGPGLVSGGNTLSPVVNLPGTYSLQVSNTVNGCTASATTSVQQDIQAPQAEAGTGFEITCTVESGNLNASGSSSGSNFSYLWNTADGHFLTATNVAVPEVDAPGTYTLLVTNKTTGCTASDQVLVTENTNYPSGLELSTTLPGCGGKPGLVRIEEIQGGVGPYLYSIDGGDVFMTANEFGGLSAGQYELVVQDANGCEYAEVLNFPVPIEPEIALNPEISLSFGESATLTALINIPLSQVDSIIWAPLESLTLTSKPNVVIAQPFKPTLYSVTLVNKEGCSDRATVLVRVDDPNIYAPNVFSPNREDGKNDYFLIYAGEHTINKINTLQIYDRWGNQVFRKDNIQPNTPKHGWDGRFRGQPMNPAVFVWWAEVELVSGQTILLKGDVTIAD